MIQRLQSVSILIFTKKLFSQKSNFDRREMQRRRRRRRRRRHLDLPERREIVCGGL